MSERERMLAGELYDSFLPELVEGRVRARRLLAAYNATDAGDREGRTRLLAELLGSAGDNVWIEPPFFCDYGENIVVGDNVHINAYCVVLDCAAVEIGSGAKLGPGAQVLTATHPVDAESRGAGHEFALPSSIGANAWLGAGALVLPGVTIGASAVVGAGSVVTHDVPPNVVAAGNPCRVVRDLDEPSDRAGRP